MNAEATSGPSQISASSVQRLKTNQLCGFLKFSDVINITAGSRVSPSYTLLPSVFVKSAFTVHFVLTNLTGNFPKC